MGERIEWGEIEPWLEEIAPDVLAALEAGEAMHAALAQHQRVGPRHEQECDWCQAMAAWRRCVAPRGEVRDARPL